MLAYFALFAAAASVFQSALLAFIVPRKRAAVLWLLATAIGASFVYHLLQQLVFNASLSAGFSSLPADTKAAILGGAFAATYSLAVGLVQGLVLAVITGRKVAAAVWATCRSSRGDGPGSRDRPSPWSP